MKVTISTIKKIFEKLQLQKSETSICIKGFIVYKGERLFPPLYLYKGRMNIPKPMLEKLRKSLYLNKEQFNELLSCKMSYKEYIESRRKNEYG